MATPIESNSKNNQVLLSLPYNRIKNLSDHLLLEILQHLSYKQSRRCLLVCKRWSMLLSQCFFYQKFIGLQRSKHIKQPYALMFHAYSWSIYEGKSEFLTTFEGTSIPVLSLDFLHSNEGNIPFFLRTCRDLLLHSSCDMHEGNNLVYYICNPLTKQWITLPPPPSRSCASVQFYSDPFYEETTTSVAINPNYKYIVLHSLLFPGFRSSSVELELFSSETQTWKSLILSVPLDLSFPSTWLEHTCIYKRTLWYLYNNFTSATLVMYKINDDDDDDDDDDDEQQAECHVINMSEDKNMNDFKPYVGICNGHLRLAKIDRVISALTHISVWELTDYREEGIWSIRHHVNINVNMHRLAYHHIQRFKIHIHLDDSDIIFIENLVGFLEYNMARQQVIKMHPLTPSHQLVRKENQDLKITGPLPFTLSWCPTPNPGIS
ncbi:hypothetical protein ACFE04_021820 [Oxalis oulophora]